jgi:hypothetical protein
MPSKEFDSHELADLSALADGSLDPAREPEVKARIAASPELSALYDRERRVVSILHAAAAADRAPDRLRARLAAQRPKRSTMARRRVTYGAGLAAALAAAVTALVLALPSGTPAAPSISQAAALAVRGVSAPAPLPDPDAPRVKLGKNIQQVYFPNWLPRFGWTAVGQRSDTINGRSAATVYYQKAGRQIAYTIISAPALTAPVASTTWLNGTELRTLAMNGRLVVTWERYGHTCVLSGNNVPAAALQRLAAWKAA